jgi:hypothetical protein
VLTTHIRFLIEIDARSGGLRFVNSGLAPFRAGSMLSTLFC